MEKNYRIMRAWSNGHVARFVVMRDNDRHIGKARGFPNKYIHVQKENKMKKILCALGVSLFVAGAAQATVITTNLGVLADGVYASGTVVTNSQSYEGATFDIVYTISATSAGADTFVSSTGTQMGVGDAVQIDGDGRDTTLDGGNDEFMSFTSLSIVNFNAGTSGLEQTDFTGLTFIGLSVNNAANSRDRIDVSFDNYATDAELVNLSAVTAEYTIDLTGLTAYSAPETDLYITPDYAWTTDRVGITGLTVEYSVIPEPATIGMLGLGAILTLMIRKKQRG
jgi:hypothetical protein